MERTTIQQFIFDNDSACNRCRYFKGLPATRYSPAEIYCEQDMDNFGTTEGCWLWEKRGE